MDLPATKPSPLDQAETLPRAGNVAEPPWTQIMEELAPLATTVVLHMDDGTQELLMDQGDQVVTMPNTAPGPTPRQAAESISREAALKRAVDAYRNELSGFEDEKTTKLIQLVDDATAIANAEEILEELRPPWAVDAPVLDKLAKQAAALRARVALTPLADLRASDAAMALGHQLRAMLRKPLLVDAAEEASCHQCGTHLAPGTWTFAPLHWDVPADASRLWCFRCGTDDRARKMVRVLFTFFPFAASKRLELFMTMEPLEVRRHFRSKFADVVAAVERALSISKLVIPEGYPTMSTPIVYNDADHYVPLLLDAVLTTLGADGSGVGRFLSAYQRRQIRKPLRSSNQKNQTRRNERR